MVPQPAPTRKRRRRASSSPSPAAAESDKFTSKIKFKSLLRQNFRCIYSEESLEGRVIEFDHLLAIHQGGLSDLPNCVATDRNIHGIKSEIERLNRDYPTRQSWIGLTAAEETVLRISRINSQNIPTYGPINTLEEAILVDNFRAKLKALGIGFENIYGGISSAVQPKSCSETKESKSCETKESKSCETKESKSCETKETKLRETKESKSSSLARTDFSISEINRSKVASLNELASTVLAYGGVCTHCKQKMENPGFGCPCQKEKARLRVVDALVGEVALARPPTSSSSSSSSSDAKDSKSSSTPPASATNESKSSVVADESRAPSGADESASVRESKSSSAANDSKSSSASSAPKEPESSSEAKKSKSSSKSKKSKSSKKEESDSGQESELDNSDASSDEQSSSDDEDEEDPLERCIRENFFVGSMGYYVERKDGKVRWKDDDKKREAMHRSAPPGTEHAPRVFLRQLQAICVKWFATRYPHVTPPALPENDVTRQLLWKTLKVFAQVEQMHCQDWKENKSEWPEKRSEWVVYGLQARTTSLHEEMCTWPEYRPKKKNRGEESTSS